MLTPKELRDVAVLAQAWREVQAEEIDRPVPSIRLAWVGEQAANLETQLLQHLVSQPLPRCPYCFEIDDDDDYHTLVGETGEGLVVQCVCGETYYANARPVTVWSTRKANPAAAPSHPGGGTYIGETPWQS